MSSQPDKPEKPEKPAAVQPLAITSWSRTIIQPILLITNTLTMLAAVLIFLQRVDAERPWTALLIPCLLIALESYSTAVWLNDPRRRQLDHTKYRAAEILVLLILLRLSTWAFQGNWPSFAGWTNYLFNPLLLFIDPFFIGAVIVGYTAWYRTTAISSVFIQLAPDAAERAYYALPRSERIEANQPLPIDREALQRSFVQQFLFGAVLLLVCVALMSIDLNKIWTAENILKSGIARLGLPPSLLAALLLYFLTGFLLLSQGRLAMMEARWLVDDVARTPGIGRSWYQRTLIILVVIGFIAAFLPLGSTFALGRILSYGIYAIMLAVSSLFYFFSVIIFSLLALLFPQQQAAEPEAGPPPRPFVMPPQQPEAAAPDATMQMIATSAFWAVAIVMSILALSFFLRERGFKFDTLLLRQLGAAFVAWCRSVWHGLRAQAAEVRETVQARLKRPSKPIEVQPPWRYVRLNSLSPREKVRYFYLSVVKRAASEGVPRRQSETPSEFAGDLKANWPDTGNEIDDLTEAFLRARYSRQPVEEADVAPIKTQWNRVKATIRRRRQTRPSAAEDDSAPPNDPQ